MRGVLLTVAAIAFAQEPIRVTTRLIETNVVVRDSHGPVGDLTQDSFTLLEDGKARRIAVFRVSKPPLKQSPLPPGLFTNRTRETGRQPHFKLILLDTMNTSYPDQNIARTQIIKMLERNEIADPMAIYVMGEQFRVLQDFTTDKEKLLAGIRSFEPGISRATTPVSAPNQTEVSARSMNAAESNGSSGKRQVMGVMADGFGGEEGLHFFKIREDMTLRAFEELAKHLERAPGRKSIIWITDSLSFDKESGHNVDRLRRLGDVAIYPVYAHGLGLTGAGIDALFWLASQTSGRAFYNTNDIGDAVKQAIHDDDVTYTLGFYSDREKPDGNVHSLEVKVARKGVDVRSRPFYADKELETPPNDDPTTLANRVASDDFDATEIGMAARILQLGKNFVIRANVDVKDLKLVRDGERWKGSATLASVSRAANGDRLDFSIKAIDSNMTDAEYQDRLKNGLAIALTMPARVGAKRIRVAIVDQSGAAGSVLVIPK